MAGLTRQLLAFARRQVTQPRPVETPPLNFGGRPVPAPGHMGVDYEERVDFQRLRDYRLGRARAALESSECGAFLLFDFYNIRYTTQTWIGGALGDKMIRYALLARGRDPVLWDFGSAARHHVLHCPWLDGRSAWLEWTAPPECQNTSEVERRCILRQSSVDHQGYPLAIRRDRRQVFQGEFDSHAFVVGDRRERRGADTLAFSILHFNGNTALLPPGV